VTGLQCDWLVAGVRRGRNRQRTSQGRRRTRPTLLGSRPSPRARKVNPKLVPETDTRKWYPKMAPENGTVKGRAKREEGEGRPCLGDFRPQGQGVRPEAREARMSPPRDDVGATALAPLLYIVQMSLGTRIKKVNTIPEARSPKPEHRNPNTEKRHHGASDLGYSSSSLISSLLHSHVNFESCDKIELRMMI